MLSEVVTANEPEALLRHIKAVVAARAQDAGRPVAELALWNREAFRISWWLGTGIGAPLLGRGGVWVDRLSNMQPQK